MKSDTRELSEEETICVKLCCTLYELLDDRKLIGRLHAKNEDTVNALSKMFKVLASVYDNDKKSYIVTLSIYDLIRYVELVCQRVGIQIEIDGAMRTYDGYWIEEQDD